MIATTGAARTKLAVQVIRTSFGIRFWDAVTDTQIRDGLTVRARPTGGGPVTIAGRTLSGVYAFHGLPGMRDLDYPLERETSRPALPGSPPIARPFEVDVGDARGRFLPVRFIVDLPHPGLYTVPTSPPDAASGFHLFSAPARTVPAGVAAIRTQLWDVARDAPAAHAVLEVSVAGTDWFGIADDRGVVVVLLPYPLFAGAIVASPPPGWAGTPLAEQAWQVQIGIRYGALWLDLRPGVVPLLGATLGQTRGAMRAVAGDPMTPVLDAQLRFGDPLLLRTEGASRGVLETIRLP